MTSDEVTCRCWAGGRGRTWSVKVGGRTFMTRTVFRGRHRVRRVLPAGGIEVGVKTHKRLSVRYWKQDRTEKDRTRGEGLSNVLRVLWNVDSGGSNTGLKLG